MRWEEDKKKDFEETWSSQEGKERIFEEIKIYEECAILWLLATSCCSELLVVLVEFLT